MSNDNLQDTQQRDSEFVTRTKIETLQRINVEQANMIRDLRQLANELRNERQAFKDALWKYDGVRDGFGEYSAGRLLSGNAIPPQLPAGAVISIRLQYANGSEVRIDVPSKDGKLHCLSCLQRIEKGAGGLWYGDMTGSTCYVSADGAHSLTP